MRRKHLDDESVAKLRAVGKRYNQPDTELPGHYVRVSPTGVKSYWVAARGPGQKHYTWKPIGSAPMRLDAARAIAKKALQSIRGGSANSFNSVAARWRKLHVKSRKLRSVSEIDRFLKRMSEAWDGRDFAGIGRADVANLLDNIELQNGPRQATYCLQVFSSLANWYAARDDNYRSPLVKGMRRGTPTKRDRILNDDELRAVWTVAETNGTYGALVRLALLTAQRQDKLASMKWEDVKDGVWTIATEDREKGNAGVLVLPEQAVAILDSATSYSKREGYVFPAAHGGGYVSGWSKMKRAFDAKVGVTSPPVSPWAFHDLRRTARSLMSRAGVQPHIAERVMGHAIAGVEGVYDRFAYKEEKADALKRLERQIRDVVTPPPNNVLKLSTALA